MAVAADVMVHTTIPLVIRVIYIRLARLVLSDLPCVLCVVDLPVIYVLQVIWVPHVIRVSCLLLSCCFLFLVLLDCY